MIKLRSQVYEEEHKSSTNDWVIEDTHSTVKVACEQALPGRGLPYETDGDARRLA